MEQSSHRSFSFIDLTIAEPVKNHFIDRVKPSMISSSLSLSSSETSLDEALQILAAIDKSKTTNEISRFRQMETCIDTFTRHLNHKPGDYLILLNLTFVFVQLGKYRQGVEICSKFLSHYRVHTIDSDSDSDNDSDSNDDDNDNTDHNTNHTNGNSENNSSRSDNSDLVILNPHKKDSRNSEMKMDLSVDTPDSNDYTSQLSKPNGKHDEDTEMKTESRANTPNKDIHISECSSGEQLLSHNSKESDITIPWIIEVQIRSNIALMALRNCDLYRAALQCHRIRDLDSTDPYPDYIESLIGYSVGGWLKTATHCRGALKRHTIKEREWKLRRATNATQNTALCQSLDKSALFDIQCIQADCYAKMQYFDKAKHCFANILPKTTEIVNECIHSRDENTIDINQTLDKYHSIIDLEIREKCYTWLWECYLTFLAESGEKRLAYAIFCIANKHDTIYFNSQFVKFGQFLAFESLPSFKKLSLVIDSETIGNQSRFVNHSDDCPNSEFVLRMDIKTSAPEIWLRTRKTVRKGDELTVNYGRKYWKHARYAKALSKRDSKWDGFIFTHAIVDDNQSNSYMLRRLIDNYHYANPHLCNKDYPSSIEVKPDQWNGYGLFAARKLKKKSYYIRCSGVRRFVSDFDHSQSRYAIRATSVNIENDRIREAEESSSSDDMGHDDCNSE